MWRRWHCHTDAVKTRQFVCDPDGKTYDNNRPRGCLHRNTQTGNDIGAVTGAGGFCDMAYRFEFGRGVVFSNPYHGGGECQANQYREVEICRGDQLPLDHYALTEHDSRKGIISNCCQPTGHRQTTIKRIHDLATLTCLDKVTANDGSNCILSHYDYHAR